MKFSTVIMAVLILVTILFGFWMTVAAPCSWYTYAPAKDIPGRCVMQ